MRQQLIFWSVIFMAIALEAQDLAVGKLLVGTKKSLDPDLGKSVILLIHYDQHGAIGLMLNGRKVPISDVVPEIKDVQLPVYAGGPVTIGLRALCRGTNKPQQADLVLHDVFVFSPKTQAITTTGGSCRLYGGYTGWTQGQLKNEVELGLWRVLPANSAIIFDQNPEALWPKLNAERR